jgi:hypothetical protein
MFLQFFSHVYDISDFVNQLSGSAWYKLYAHILFLRKKTPLISKQYKKAVSFCPRLLRYVNTATTISSQQKHLRRNAPLR